MGQTDIVKLLLDAGADVNAKGGNYGFAIQAASYHGKKNIVKLLLDAGAQTDNGDNRNPALHMAAIEGHGKSVELLIATGADVNSQFQDKTAFQYVLSDWPEGKNGKKDMVALLLDKGADISMFSSEETAVIREIVPSGNLCTI